MKKRRPFIPRYYNYGKKGDIKLYCPLFKKANQKYRKLQINKVYVTWENKYMESSDD